MFIKIIRSERLIIVQDTLLGIKGNEHNGPKEAAAEILKYITGEKELKTLEDDE